MGKLNLERPNIHIIDDALRITSLYAQSMKLSRDQTHKSSPKTLQESFDQVRHLTDSIRQLQLEINEWTSAVGGIWKAKFIDAAPFRAHYQTVPGHPLASFHCSHLLSYSDTWFAYIWIFHAACRILLHESLINLIMFYATAETRELADDEQVSIQREEDSIQDLSASILRSFPPLMGLINGIDQELLALPQGKMAGRFLAMFAIDVVSKAKSTSIEHKQIVTDLAKWMRTNYAFI